MMARKGRAGSALAIAALGSFFAGCVATAVVALFSQPLVRVAGSFQSPDYFGLLVFGMVAAVVLAQGSVVRSVAMVVLGLFLGLIGTDIASGQTRFTFGISALADGIGFVPVAMGLFGIAEVIASLERGGAKPQGRSRRSAGCGRRARRRGRPGPRCCAAPASARCSACCRAAAR